MVSGRVARVFAEESKMTEKSYSQEENSQSFRTAFPLFAGYVDAASTVAQNCGGGFGPNLLSFSIFEGNSSSILSYRQLRIKV